MSLQQFKSEFDPPFLAYIENQIQQARGEIVDDAIFTYLGHLPLLLKAGKRFRPFVLDLAYRTAGGSDNEQSRSFGFGIEAFHNFCLIHDDITDRASVRHGVPTIDQIAMQDMPPNIPAELGQHTGGSHALLVGDLLFAWSMAQMYAYLPQEQIKAGRNLIQQMINEVVIGQMIDVDLPVRLQVSRHTITTKTLLKTALYSFVRPMQLGVLLSGNPNPQLMQFCHNFGVELGMAYQIEDDLLDILSDEKTMGKNVSNDLRNGQRTYLTEFIEHHKDQKWQTQLTGLLQSDSLGNTAKIPTLFIESGAIAWGKELFAKHISAAKKVLSGFSVTEAHKGEWEDLIGIFEARLP